MSKKKNSIKIPINEKLNDYKVDWKGAFLDILLMDTPITISNRKLSERWGFTLGKTQNILKKLQEDGLIYVTNNKSCITIDISTNQTPIEKVKKVKTINIPFEVFWELYNKKKGMSLSKAKWNSLTNKDREQIMIHLPIYLSTIKDKQYQKYPASYLTQKLWLDIDIKPNKPKEDETITIINNKKYEK